MMSYIHDNGNGRRPLAVPMPFVRQTHGLGDVVAGVTQAVGVKPCAPCKRRQALLNRLLQVRPIRGW